MSKHVLQYREEVIFGHQVVPSKVFLIFGRYGVHTNSTMGERTSQAN